MCSADCKIQFQLSTPIICNRYVCVCTSTHACCNMKIVFLLFIYLKWIAVCTSHKCEWTRSVTYLLSSVKLRRMKWGRYVACMGVVRHTSNIFVRNLEGMRLLERLSTVKKNLKEVGCILDWTGSGYCPVEGCYEYGNEPLRSIEDDIFLDHLSNYRLFKDTAPW